MTVISQICGLTNSFFVLRGFIWSSLYLCLAGLSWGLLVFLYVGSLSSWAYLDHGSWVPRSGFQESKPVSINACPSLGQSKSCDQVRYQMREGYTNPPRSVPPGSTNEAVCHNCGGKNKAPIEIFIFLLKPKGLGILGGGTCFNYECLNYSTNVRSRMF